MSVAINSVKSPLPVLHGDMKFAKRVKLKHFDLLSVL